jgi:hypothetical protein
MKAVVSRGEEDKGIKGEMENMLATGYWSCHTDYRFLQRL